MSKRQPFKSRKNSDYNRRMDFRELRERFLIVCEGKKTEPNYFNKFRVTKLILDIIGPGYNTVGLVQHAINEKKKDEYTQVWCVFDRDSFPAENFNRAFELAKNNNIRIAYSNQAFELWYLLHFNYYTTALTRNDYIEVLNKLLKKRYEKNSTTIFEELAPRQATAIQNARRLLLEYDPHNPESNDPSTTVYLLVEELNRFSI